MIELIARIRAVLRRIRPGLADDRIDHGDIVIDRVAHRVRRAGNEIHLGPTEFRLLDHFMQHPGRVFSREQLLDAVWGSDVYVEARTVDVHVGRLRKALNVEGSGQSDPHRALGGLFARSGRLNPDRRRDASQFPDDTVLPPRQRRRKSARAAPDQSGPAADSAGPRHPPCRSDRAADPATSPAD